MATKCYHTKNNILHLHLNSRNSLLVFFAFVLLICSFDGEAKSFYFSASSGNDLRTIAQAQNPVSPWKSLKKLEESYIDIAPGDSILFKRGDKWTGQALEPRVDGLFFGNYGNGPLPMIDGLDNVALNITTAFKQDFTFDGLAFSRSGTKGVVAQLGSAWSDVHAGMTNSKIINCVFWGSVVLQGAYNVFENNTVDGVTNDGNGNGIWEHHKYCHHNVYRNNRVRNFSVRGIWTMIETHDSIFENNVVNDCQSAGIDLDGASSLVYSHVVRSNRIFNIKNDAIELENAFNCQVANNFMYNGGRSYIYVINYEKCKIVDGYGEKNGIGAILNSTLFGNVMIGGGIDYSSVAIGIYKAGGINVYNNSIYNFESRFFDLDYEDPGEVQQIRLVNNVFSTNKTQSWYGMINFSSDNLDLLEEDDYNCFYNQGRNDIYSNRGSYFQQSLAQYSKSTGKGLHSISADPLFVSEIDLRLQENSPCVDSGKMLGLPFKGNKPDIGAYEFLGSSSIPSFTVLDSITKPSDPLSVTLMEFLVRAEGQRASIAWSTTTESNANHFEIEHSTDARSWVVVGWVNALGESASLVKYDFVHNNPLTGKNYYRLRMVDNDGSYARSKMGMVHFDGGNPLIVFPNPATEKIFLGQTLKSKIINASIYNHSGDIVYQNPVFPVEGIVIAKFTAGSYVLVLTENNGKSNKYTFIKH